MDDDAVLRTELAAYLSVHGFEVTCCGTATEAKEQLGNHAYDLVISDIFVRSNGEFVPDGGIRLVGWMQVRYDIPVIAMTGVVDTQGGGYLQNMRDLGATVCLEKPIDEAVLLQHVRNLTAKKAAT